MRLRTLVRVSLVLLLSRVTLVAADRPADTLENPDAAAASVAAAMKAETEGDFLARQRLLAEAELSGDFAPAKWQRGQIKQADGSWSDIESSMKRTDDDQKVSQYELARDRLNDTFENHVSLATVCARQGLYSQCRAHLSRALEFQPDNVQIRQALGYRQVDGDWISPSKIAELEQRTQATLESVEKHGKAVLAIASKLSSLNHKERESGAAELDKLSDPSALPAVDSILASPFPQVATSVIDWLAKIDTVESSQALARYSLAHPADSVRDYATSKLKLRPFHDFVPDMLEMLASKVSMMAIPEFNRRGELTGYRQAFTQEKFDKQNVMFIDRNFTRDRVNVRSGVNRIIDQVAASEANANMERSLREFATAETGLRSAAIVRENAEVARRNARIADVLSQIAGQEFLGEPKPMWKWWDKYNETKYQDYKPERYVRSALSNRVPQYNCECFVAGTEVVTSRGMKPIERITVGDSVLSRSVSTGELGWKPVLQATTRPPEQTSVVSVENEEFRCTYGHLFWVSGAGWKKANELKSGDILHAAEEPKVVMSVKEAAAAQTYNLEVADNGTYFVGKAMIMTHDVTPRTHNRQLVPGQSILQQ